MALWDWFTKATDTDIAATVPLITDTSAIQYPPDNYGNFAAQGYGRNEIVHACIKELATGVAGVKFFAGAESSEGGVEAIEGPLADLIAHPNPNEDFYTFIERMVTFLQVAGNVYILKERDRTNQIIAIWLLRPDRVSIKPEDRGINAYSYEIDGAFYQIAADDIAHLALPNPSGDVYGMSPLHVLAKTVNLDMNMTDFAKAYFQNAGVPSGLLKVKRRLTSQEDANRIRARWRSTFGGSDNLHKVAVLDDDAEYQAMASAPREMALPELHALTESRICAVFGVPPILISANVGLQRSTFANYREARFSFHSETLEPLIQRLVRFLNYCLKPDYGEYGEIMVDLSEMRSFLDDRDSMSSRASSLFGAGIITLNEARELVGVDAVDGGDLRRVPMNIIESSEVDSAPPPPAALPEGSDTEETLALGFMKAPRVAPRAGILRRELLEAREVLTDRLEKDMTNYFHRLRSRIDGVLGRHMERATDISKQFPFNFTDLVPDGTEGELSDILFRNYVRVTRDTFKHINNSGMAGVLEWAENLPAVVAVTTQASARAKLIHSTTKKAIQKGIQIGLERGYSIEQVARGVPAEKFPGLRAIAGENVKRARLIARTEIMRTQNLSSMAHYKEQGFEYVRADDLDGDPDDDFVPSGDPYGRTCIERNGEIYHIDDAYNIEDHPNGTLNWQPMPRSYRREVVV